MSKKRARQTQGLLRLFRNIQMILTRSENNHSCVFVETSLSMCLVPSLRAAIFRSPIFFSLLARWTKGKGLTRSLVNGIHVHEDHGRGSLSKRSSPADVARVQFWIEFVAGTRLSSFLKNQHFQILIWSQTWKPAVSVSSLNLQNVAVVILAVLNYLFLLA